MVFGAIVFIFCGFAIGCACMTVKKETTENKIEYNTKGTEDEKVRDYVCPTLPEELNKPQFRIVVNALATHGDFMTASEIGESCGFTPQRVSAIVGVLVARGYVSSGYVQMPKKEGRKAYKIN